MPAYGVKDFLEDQGIDFEIISHASADTAEEIAALTHISGRELAKTVVVNIDGTLAMAVVPASRRVDFAALQSATGAKMVRLASEADFENKFPGCETGAMPPFGNLYGMAVSVDEAIAVRKFIVFNAGSHTELVRLAYSDFAKLVVPTAVRLAAAVMIERAA